MNVKPATLRIGLLTAMILVLCSACGSDESQATADGLVAIAADSDGELVVRTVPFISLRNRTGSEAAAEYFGGERSALKTGSCDVSYKPIKLLQPIAQKLPFYVPEDIAKLDTISESSTQDLWAGLEATRDGKRPILYSHGFYMSFERSCKRAALFQNSLDVTGRLLLFSWPSDGAILNYTRDESDLYWSVEPLRNILGDMVDRFGQGNIDLVAHSLGTRGVMLALARLAGAHQGKEPLINQVVLIAPDIDAQIFEQYLPLIRPLVQNITVYVSANDSPLALSRQVHGYPRLGEAGAHLKNLAGVDIIDLSDIPVRYISGHVYHLYHDQVISDISQLLNEGKLPSERSNLQQTGKTSWRLTAPAPG